MIIQKFEPFILKCKNEVEKTWVWCPIRNKWLILTPEEWVRQQWIQYFLSMNYPKGWMVSEYALNYENKKNIRIDLALLKPNQKIWLLAEFKKLNYQINIKDLEQIIRYAYQFHPEYLMISNYETTYIWNSSEKKWEVL